MSDIKKKEDTLFKEELSSDEGSSTDGGNNHTTVPGKKKDASTFSVISSTYGTTELKDDEKYKDVHGYEPDLEWEEHEEAKVRRKIDVYLMPFLLLMAFVLNMDRTNHCKPFFSFFFCFIYKTVSTHTFNF